MPAQPFRHVHAEKAALYRAVMRAFSAARRRFLVHLRPEDVQADLAAEAGTAGRTGLEAGAASAGLGTPTLEELAQALASLVEWGNLRADADTSRVESVDDFYRKRLLYQLTPEGEAAEAALETYDRTLGHRGELQAVALDDIRFHLRALGRLLEEGEDDAERAHRLLRDLVLVFERLADNAQAFMASLRRTIDLQDGDVEAFVAYKERLVSYLERFVGDLTRASHEIAELLRGLPEAGVERLLRLAAGREAADALPSPDSGRESEREDLLAQRIEAWQLRWSGLASWFVGDRRRPSQASLLRRRARAAIPELLSAVAALNERRSTRTDRAADFRTLAAWFAEAPDEAGCHRLWRAAFALHSSRHLSVDAATLDERAEHRVPASTSWRDAPPVVISPRLRATGSHQRKGRPRQVQDRSKEKRYLASLLADEQRSLESARAELLAAQPARLSELGPLSEEAFTLLLSLLGEALALRASAAQRVRCSSPDGRLELELGPAAEGARAVLASPRGRLACPDFALRLRSSTEPSHANAPMPGEAEAAGHERRRPGMSGGGRA